MVVRRELEQVRSELLLPSDDTAPSRARREVRALLARWGLTDLLDPVQLAVSELVTNAVRYGRPPVRLTLRADGAALAAGVHDGGHPLHRDLGEPGPDAESGRGLAILAALGEQTGTRAERRGKVVWIRFRRGPGREGAPGRDGSTSLREIP